MIKHKVQVNYTINKIRKLLIHLDTPLRLLDTIAI